MAPHAKIFYYLIIILLLIPFINAETIYNEITNTQTTTDTNNVRGGVCFRINASITDNVYLKSLNRTPGCTAKNAELLYGCATNPGGCTATVWTGVNTSNNLFTLATPLLLNKSLEYCVAMWNNDSSSFTRYYGDAGAPVKRPTLNYTDTFYTNGKFPANYNYMNVFITTIQVGDTVTNSCSYTSGNWNINIKDNCNITTAISLNRANLTINGSNTSTDRLYITGSIKNFSNIIYQGVNTNTWGILG
jgi:hypothetical protein